MTCGAASGDVCNVPQKMIDPDTKMQMYAGAAGGVSADMAIRDRFVAIPIHPASAAAAAWAAVAHRSCNPTPVSRRAATDSGAAR